MDLQNFFHGLSLAGQEGSGVLIPFTVSPGDLTLSFDYDFLSNENFQTMPHADFTLVAVFSGTNFVAGTGGSLGAIDPSNPFDGFTLFGGQDTFQFSYRHTSPHYDRSVSGFAPGSYTLGIGIEDATNIDHGSGLAHR